MLDTVFPKYVKNKQLVELILLILPTTSNHSLVIHFSLLESTNILKQTVSDKAKTDCRGSSKRHDGAGLGGEEGEAELERRNSLPLDKKRGSWMFHC